MTPVKSTIFFTHFQVQKFIEESRQRLSRFQTVSWNKKNTKISHFSIPGLGRNYMQHIENTFVGGGGVGREYIALTHLQL